MTVDPFERPARPGGPALPVRKRSGRMVPYTSTMPAEDKAELAAQARAAGTSIMAILLASWRAIEEMDDPGIRARVERDALDYRRANLRR